MGQAYVSVQADSNENGIMLLSGSNGSITLTKEIYWTSSGGISHTLGWGPFTINVLVNGVPSSKTVSIAHEGLEVEAINLNISNALNGITVKSLDEIFGSCIA